MDLTKNLLPIDAVCDLHDNSREDKADNVQLDRDRTNFLHRTPTGVKEIRSKQRRQPTGRFFILSTVDARERARRIGLATLRRRRPPRPWFILRVYIQAEVAARSIRSSARSPRTRFDLARRCRPFSPGRRRVE